MPANTTTRYFVEWLNDDYWDPWCSSLDYRAAVELFEETVAVSQKRWRVVKETREVLSEAQGEKAR